MRGFNFIYSRALRNHPIMIRKHDWTRKMRILYDWHENTKERENFKFGMNTNEREMSRNVF